MRDYINEIYSFLNNGRKVIIYSVGGDTLNILRALKNKYDILPTALCDKDERKQGRTFNGLYDMEPMSPVNAFAQYPDAYWFISTLEYKYQVIGELTESIGVKKENIINYEPVIKRKSCSYLEKSLVCDEYRRFSFCWYQPENLSAVEHSGDYAKSFEKFIELRDKTIDCYNNECGNCCFYKEDYYPAERKIRWINYGVGGICNFKCIYCKSNAKTAHYIDEKIPWFVDIVKYLTENNLLADDYGVNIAPGEPTVHPWKKELFNAMNNCYSCVVNTNLSVFDNQLYDIAANNFTKLVVSIDSGTKETFKRIKGRDVFEKVCNNLKKYSEAGSGVIVLKYIFIPGVNDDDDNVDGFAKICHDTGCLIGNISYDYGSPLPIPEKTIHAMRRLRDKLAELNILCTSNVVYSSSDYVKELNKV